ncbi:MAG: DUF255 domain-containing protein [Pseudomonadota bacterium]
MMTQGLRRREDRRGASTGRGAWSGRGAALRACLAALALAAASAAQTAAASPDPASAPKPLAAPAITPPPGAPPPAPSALAAWREAAARLAGGRAEPGPVNRLILAASPWLRARGRDPMDWRSLNDAASARAASRAATLRGAPLMIVLPPPPCQPCGARSSAETLDLRDADLAGALNAAFVVALIGPEAPPALAARYRAAAARLGAATGARSIILWARPDGAPFFAAQPRANADLRKAAAAIETAWAADRATLGAMAEAASRGAALARPSAEAADPEALRAALARAAAPWIADPALAAAAARPEEGALFLLDRWRREGDEGALSAAGALLETLLREEAKAESGAPRIFRLAPRLDGAPALKIARLGEQARIAKAFLAGWEATGDARLRAAATRVLDAALKHLRAGDGAFIGAIARAAPRASTDPRAPLRGNGAMIAALADGAAALDRGDWGAAAARAADAIWERRSGFDPSAGEAASAADLAAFGLGALALARPGAPARHEARAWAFVAPALAPRAAAPAFWGGESADPEPVLRLAAALRRREGGLQLHRKAKGALHAAAGLIAGPSAPARPGLLEAVAIALDGPSAPRRALSQGRVWAEARRAGAALRLTLHIAEGWHVNAHRVTHDFLTPTDLTGEAISAARYPAPEPLSVSFEETPLAVLSGVAVIEAALTANRANAPVAATLLLQACSLDMCLAPEQAAFRLGPTP